MAENDNRNEGIDLSGRFKNSSTGVQFQNEWRRPADASYPGAPKIIQWAMKYSGGYVKDEKQASYVLLGFVILAAIIFLMVILGGGSERPSGPPTPLQVQKGDF